MDLQLLCQQFCLHQGRRQCRLLLRFHQEQIHSIDISNWYNCQQSCQPKLKGLSTIIMMDCCMYDDERLLAAAGSLLDGSVDLVAGNTAPFALDNVCHTH
jgi:hypothetical protein